jgi:GNAT superfamily N-acetyltransferase
MAPHLRLTRSGTGATLAESRRLEELSLNASGAFQSLVYDGWLVAYRKGPTKRLRCVNPFYPSSLPLEEKVDYCTQFYAAANLPAIFRLLPFSQPPALDAYLERAGWGSFERTLVLRAALGGMPTPVLPDAQVDIVPPSDWVQTVAPLLAVTADALPQMIERAKNFPLPHAGAVIRRDGAVVACGLLKLENEHAGLFAVHTASAVRGMGLGRAIVAALLAEAMRHGTHRVSAGHRRQRGRARAVPPLCVYNSAYDYWWAGAARRTALTEATHIDEELTRWPSALAGGARPRRDARHGEAARGLVAGATAAVAGSRPGPSAALYVFEPSQARARRSRSGPSNASARSARKPRWRWLEALCPPAEGNGLSQ